MNIKKRSAVRIGIGGPVGAGKTSLTAAIVKDLRDRFSVGVITNDIYTKEDAEALMRISTSSFFRSGSGFSFQSKSSPSCDIAFTKLLYLDIAISDISL